MDQKVPQELYFVSLMPSLFLVVKSNQLKKLKVENDSTLDHIASQKTLCKVKD
jgi:hypothetical protein